LPKFTNAERELVKSITAMLSIKKVSDGEIVEEIYRRTNKTITKKALFYVRRDIKKESYEWYKTMREGQYEFIHEFKERINEIYWLQQYHHNIIDNNKTNPQLQQTSLAELHRLNITLSNYFDVAPDIINGSTLSETPKAKAATTSIIV
jgi:hypothetical protein